MASFIEKWLLEPATGQPARGLCYRPVLVFSGKQGNDLNNLFSPVSLLLLKFCFSGSDSQESWKYPVLGDAVVVSLIGRNGPTKSRPCRLTASGSPRMEV